MSPALIPGVDQHETMTVMLSSATNARAVTAKARSGWISAAPAPHLHSVEKMTPVSTVENLIGARAE